MVVSPVPPNLPIRKDIFLKERIQGATFFDLVEVKDEMTYLPDHPIMMLKDTEKFKNYMKKLDIGFDDMVVLYDDYGMAGACKAWYMLRAYGKTKNVYILNGGFGKWKTEQLPIEEGEFQEKEIPERDETNFQNYIFNEKFDISENELICLINSNYANAENKKVQIIDARSEAIFKDGDSSKDYLKKGHVKGAINIPFRSLFYDDYTLKNLTDLKLLFETKGINFENQIISYCFGGVAAACPIFALHQCGAKNLVIYNGGFVQFGHVTNTNDQYIQIE